MASIPVSKVAKGLLIDAENYARSRKTDSNPQEATSITYENSDILALLSTN